MLKTDVIATWLFSNQDKRVRHVNVRSVSVALHTMNLTNACVFIKQIRASNKIKHLVYFSVHMHLLSHRLTFGISNEHIFT